MESDLSIPHLDDASPEELHALLSELRGEVSQRQEQRPADFFPWHQQQDKVFELPKIVLDQEREVRIIMALGGNGAGKSKVGHGLISKIVRREHPLVSQLKTMDPITHEVRPKTEDDPLRIWVVPPSDEKLEQDIWSPADGKGLPYWIGPELVADNRMGLGRYKITTTYGDEIFGKTQNQSLATFESSEVDVIWFDEEPLDEAQFNSAMMRLRTTHGFILLTFTPLHGLSWSYERFFKPLVVQGRASKHSDRAWLAMPDKGRNVVIVQMGTRDNPLAADFADEIEADPELTDAEKKARLYGEYGFVEGALLRRLSGLDLETPTGFQEDYVVDVLPGQVTHEDGARNRIQGGIARWLMVADPNKSFGAVLCAQDYDDNLFFVAEHLEEGWADAQHVQAFRQIEKLHGAFPVQRYADPGGAGAHAQVNLQYHGLAFQNVQKGAGSVSRSIKKLRGRTWFDPTHHHPITGKKGAPRVYFYRPGLLREVTDPNSGVTTRRSLLVEQLSQARQSEKKSDAPDTPHKDIKNRLDLFDVARYAADILAGSAPPDEGELRERRAETEYRANHLPTDDELGVGEERLPGDPSNYELHTPGYQFPL